MWTEKMQGEFSGNFWNKGKAQSPRAESSRLSRQVMVRFWGSFKGRVLLGWISKPFIYLKKAHFLPKQGSDPWSLYWKHGVLTTGLPGNSLKIFYTCSSGVQGQSNSHFTWLKEMPQSNYSGESQNNDITQQDSVSKGRQCYISTKGYRARVIYVR